MATTRPHPRACHAARSMFLIVICAPLAACSPSVQNASGRQVIYEDPGTVGRVAGVGFESQDLLGSTDRMVRDMLANPTIGGAAQPPRVIVDSAYFHNESSSRINVNVITDRLRSALNQAAGGRLVFVGREYVGMVETERSLKRTGHTDGGTTGAVRQVAGADYRLGGRVTSLDGVRSDGLASRYHQLVFEMIDLESGVIVWNGQYEFRKSAQDDVVYR